jgi:calcineurin-like phosphoesterase family protein
MLHGHTHGHDTYEVGYKRLNVGIMCHDYFPISLKEVVEKLKDAKIFKHH